MNCQPPFVDVLLDPQNSASSLQSFRRSTIESRIDDEWNGYQEPEVLKPKSDSYVSKIASHTRKVASKLVKPKGATSSTDGSKKSKRSKHRSTNVSSSEPTEDKSSSHVQNDGLPSHDTLGSSFRNEHGKTFERGPRLFVLECL